MAVVTAGQIDAFTPEDVQQVVALHLRAFPASSQNDVPHLHDYYRRTFFEHPWLDAQITSLVYRDPAEGVTGFVGCIPRNMWFDDRPIRVAVPHRLMAQPGRGGAMIGIRLVESLLAGKQDLTFGDGGTEAGKSLLTFGGAQVAVLYCMHWVRPLRPLAFAASLSRKVGVPSWGADLLTPLTWAGDRILRGMRGRVEKAAKAAVTASPVSAQALLDVIRLCSGRFTVRPQYELHEVDWLLSQLRNNKSRWDLRVSVVTRGGRLVGGYLWYLDAHRNGEVVFLASAKGAEDVIFDQLLGSAYDDGAAALFGRFDPSFVESYWKANCFVKRGDWAMVHSRDPAIATSVLACDAFFTALEGELWLAGPNTVRH